MKIYRKTVFSLLLAFKLAAIQASPLLAEEPTSQWDKVVVIGTKTEKPLLESHQAISVLTSEDIENSGAQDITDVLRKIPGVNVDGGPRALGETINIRGMGDSRVQVRVDGARMNFLTGHKGRLFVDPDSIEKIEVLRGNGSALYGSDAIGGVINITTKDPSDMLDEDETFGVRAGFTYNSVNDGFRKSGSVFGKPIDEFEYLTNYSHWQTGDEIKLGDGTDLGNSQQRGYESLGKFIYHPTESSDIAITYSMFTDESTIPSNPSTASVTSSNPLMERDTSRELLKLGYKNESKEGFFGDLEANIYYQITELRENKLTGSSRVDDRQTDTFGLELKNSNAFETGELPHILTYGIEYYKDQTESNQVTSSASSPIGSFPNGDFMAGAVFIQDEISLFDEKLTLIPGLRWDTFESKSSGNADNEDDQVSPKIGAVYKLTEDIRLFANFGKGFRAPRLLELFQSGQHFPGNSFVANPNLVAEESTNLDAGVRGKWKGVDFESVYYHIDAENFIASTVGATTTTIANVNDVEIWGVENYLGYNFGNGFSTYATFELAKGDNETSNTPLSSIMPKNGTWGLTYEDEEFGFRANVESVWADKKSDAPSSEVETGGYAVWDLKLSQKLPWFENTKLHFGIENIADKTYKEHLSSINAPGRNFVTGFSTALKW